MTIKHINDVHYKCRSKHWKTNEGGQIRYMIKSRIVSLEPDHEVNDDDESRHHTKTRTRTELQVPLNPQLMSYNVQYISAFDRRF